MAEAPNWDEFVDNLNSLQAHDQQIENIEVSTAFLLDKLFEKTPEWSIPPRDPKNPKDSAVFYDFVSKWERIYLTHERTSTGLKEGFKRLLANDGKDLKMVYRLTQKHQVPFEIVFLALAESHWKNFGENGAYAAGIWQFIPKTAQEQWLNNASSQSEREPLTDKELLKMWDERLDIEKATEAGIQYLKYLKERVEFTAKVHQIDINEDEAWSYAMWHYNRWPRVKTSFLTDKWNAVRYSANLLKQGDWYGRTQSANYVPKIWWLRLALKQMYEDWEFSNIRSE